MESLRKVQQIVQKTDKNSFLIDMHVTFWYLWRSRVPSYKHLPRWKEQCVTFFDLGACALLMVCNQTYKKIGNQMKLFTGIVT